MIKYVALLGFSLLLVSAIDHTVFKSCSETPFCTRLRNEVLDVKKQYFAQITQVTSEENVLTVPLENKNGEKLNLLVYLLGNKSRVKIQELENKRFELGDIVIIEDLKTIKFTQKVNDDELSIISKDDSKYKVVVTKGPPFTVNFYYQDKLQVILNGDRLLMENTEESQAFTFKVEFPESEKLYGLHDHAWTMSLGDTNDGSTTSMDPFRLRNSDSWGYEANSPMALYGSRPVIYGHSTSQTSGIFLHNAAEQWIDAASTDENPSAYFIVHSAAFDLFVLHGPSPKDIVRQFTGLTGKAHLPQIWALGYHQCRFSYKSQDDVKTVAALLDANNFPWDAIWLDGDHTDDYRWFHWNSTTYTDPVELQQNISATGRVCVSISDPHIKVEDTYDVYAGAKRKYFVKWANGSDYVADCWPGASSWIDYMDPEASDYYGKWYAYDKFNGSTPTLAGIWNDMNEPAVFDDTIEKSMPYELVHYGNATHGNIHNIYGFLQTRSTHKGLLDRDNKEKRPFILTRSHFAGSQRYAAMWTGDNTATWEHFANSYSQCMNANMMGMVFCGADIGGFIGDPSDELLQRWYQGAVWLTFFRGHSSRESKRREPYLFSEEVQEVLRKTLYVRYQHIPSFYTLFYEHTRNGDPIIRPLYYEYTSANDLDTQVLVGTDIMGVAVTEAHVKTVDVYIPGNETTYWYRVDDGSWDVYEGGKTEKTKVDINTSPYYYKAGSIIFRKDVPRKSAVAAIHDPMSVYVNLDQDNKAYARLYVDDYYSFNYENNKDYFYVQVEYDANLDYLRIARIDGEDTGMDVTISNIVVHKIKNEDKDKLRSQKKVYSKTSDGISLKNLDIAKELRASKSQEIIIKL
ncbi:neutral alpha-glucosidase AB-like [Diorhabda sublineata]|uniref:neutral alpha-glucosidase AB-like n=1 Tax=Diorhabda sublineata TaxID=1163346 RepID=UPI0024E190B4|nr:neutral alpha-glucosidase AB-like [Diorhabda sublineata]